MSTLGAESLARVLATSNMGRKIIVIDDDQAFVEALKLYLEDQGFQVLAALNGRDGMELFRGAAVDVAIVDMHLPDLEGVKIVREARRQSPDTSLVLISSDDSPETLQKCRQAKIHRLMLKPLLPRELLAVVSEAISPGA